MANLQEPLVEQPWRDDGAALEALPMADARFQAMFDNAAVGIAILDLERRIRDANPVLCQMLGYTRAELQALPPMAAPDVADRPASNLLFAELVAGRRASYCVERRTVHKSGRVFWTQVMMSGVRGPEGELRFLVGMVIDIDEQRRMQEALRESEARFRAMFDHAAVGMALLTLDRRVLEVNQSTSRITGYSLAELSALDPVQLTHPDDREVGQEAFRELVAGRRDDYQVERRYRHKSGRVFWARVSYSTVPGPDGRPEYLIGMIEDIDEQRAAREQLVAQEHEHRRRLEDHVEARTRELSRANRQLQREMVQRQQAEAVLAQKAAEEAVLAERTRLAHDLHDAVTQTLFSASLIAEVLPDLWEMDAGEARRSTEELRQLTRGALAEMRTLLLELRPAALTQARFGDLLKQLVEALAGRTRLPIALSLTGEGALPPEVQVALYRIAQESLNNAVKYARARQVKVCLTLGAAGACLEIGDDGVGFDLGARRPDSLGLRIMRERAQAIGADLRLTSAPGQGTQVSVTWAAGQGSE